jgi:non-heme chloroperoxidase
MTVIGTQRTGRGLPVTVFAPGGRGTIAEAQPWDVGFPGTRVFYENERIAPWDVPGSASPKRPRGAADRDADELLAVADKYEATRAVGMSRGARAIVGLLAGQPDRFERLALVLPPGGFAPGRYARWLASSLPSGHSSNADDRYAKWMASLSVSESTPAGRSAEILVVAQRGDQGHPVRVAEEWAGRLGDARLEVFPSGGLLTEHRERFRSLIIGFMNE